MTGRNTCPAWLSPAQADLLAGPLEFGAATVKALADVRRGEYRMAVAGEVYSLRVRAAAARGQRVRVEVAHLGPQGHQPESEVEGFGRVSGG